MLRLRLDDVHAVVDALRRSHLEHVALANAIGPTAATEMSYCTEWTVAQVYSHLGSGAEILEPVRLPRRFGATGRNRKRTYVSACDRNGGLVAQGRAAAFPTAKPFRS